MWFPNPNRIRELFDEEKVRRAAQAILSYANRDVARALAWAWAIALVMVLTLLLTVRIGLTLPFPWHG